MAIERPILRAEGISDIVDDEVLISSRSILMDSGRTLQEEWEALCRNMLTLKDSFEAVKSFIGSRIPIPYQKNILTYAKGVWQEPVWVGFNSEFMAKSGTEKSINAGKYDVTFVLNNPDYIWSDGSVKTATVSWYIKRAEIPYPIQQEPYPVFNGDIKELVWNNVSMLEVEIVGGASAVSEAGIHIVSVKPTSNYCWPDSSYDEKEFTWKIERAVISVPVQTGTLFFNGHEQRPVWDANGKETLVTVVDGAGTGIEAKTYEVWFKPTDNAIWEDGTSNMKKAVWTISPKLLDNKVTGPDGLTTNVKVTFNGTEQIPVFVNYDPAFIKASDISINSSGETVKNSIIKHRNAGSYVTEFVPRDNCSWSDGSKTPVLISWSVQPRAVKIPDISYEGSSTVELEYTGDNIGPDINNLETDWVTADNIKGITVGTRTAQFSLKEADNTVWTDGGTQLKVYPWKIIPKKLKVPVVLEASVPYNGGFTVHPVIEEYDTRFISVTGDSAVNVRNDYMITFSLVDPVNTCWEDGSLDPKSATWSVTALEITAPTVTNLSFTYNNTWQGPDISDYDSRLIVVTGKEGKNADSYSLIMTLSESGIIWSDTKDSEPKVITWTINKKWIPVPTVNTVNKEYNGKIQYLTATGNNGEIPFELNTATYLRDSYSSNYLEIKGLSGKNASDSYVAVASLTDTDNTIWETGNADPISFPWKILPKVLAVPVATGSYIFDGESKECNFDNFLSDYMTVTGHQASSAGQHTAVFDLKDKVNTVWPDGSTTSKNVIWRISTVALNPADLSLEDLEFVYDGSTHTVTEDDITGFSDLFRLEGQTSGTVARNYTVNVYLADPESYCWSDGREATASVDFVWQIKKRVMQIPVIAGTSTAYTYSGETYEITKDKCVFGDINDSSFILLKDNTGSVAKSYTVTFSIDPDHIANCEWTDGSTEDKRVNWTINKAYIKSWGVEKSTVNITGEAGSYVDVAVIRPGDGKVNVTSASDYLGAEVIDSTGTNPVLRFTDLNGPVQTTATVKVEEGTNYFSSNISNIKTSGACPYTLDIRVNVLTRRSPADFTPARIKDIVQQGLASTIWEVGDKIPISFNSFTLSGTGRDYIPAGTYDAIILGFDHNRNKENPAASHTMTVAVMYKHDITDKAICFFDRNVSDPLDAYYGYYNDNIFNALNSSWKEVITTTRKYTATGYQDSEIFNLASYEVYGNGGPGSTPASDWYDDKQKQYDYFKANNFPLVVYPQYLELGEQGVIVTCRSQGTDIYSDTVIAFLTQSGYYYNKEQDRWLPYDYGDWCNTPLPYHTTNYSANIQTGIIPCFNIG